MPLTTSNPEIIDGVEYPYLAIHVAMSPQWRESDMGAMVAARFPLYRIDENGHIEQSGTDRSLVLADAFAQAENDPAIAEFVRTFLAAVQTLVTAKGI